MAEIIYPAAFHGARATPAPADGAEDPGLRALRAATQDSLRRLRAARVEAEAVHRLGDGLRAEAAEVDAASADLGRQMDRLIAETRRMTDYLRGQS